MAKSKKKELRQTYTHVRRSLDLMSNVVNYEELTPADVRHLEYYRGQAVLAAKVYRDALAVRIKKETETGGMLNSQT